MNTRKVWILAAPLIGAGLAALGWAGFAPIEVGSREQLFEIPKGTYARRRVPSR